MFRKIVLAVAAAAVLATTPLATGSARAAGMNATAASPAVTPAGDVAHADADPSYYRRGCYWYPVYIWKNHRRVLLTYRFVCRY